MCRYVTVVYRDQLLPAEVSQLISQKDIDILKNFRKIRYFTYLTQKKVHFLQIIEKDSAAKDLKIQYYVVDACNGFQREDKLYWISESQVV